jgi:peptidoglycan hydrolase CwlO-like protein
VKLHLTTLLAFALVVPACSRNEPRSTQAAPEERTNATDQMKAQRDQYVKDMDARMDEFDKKVDGLNERVSAMSGQAKASFKDNIDRLQDQRKEVAKKLDDLKSVNIESWTTMRGEVDSAMAGLDRSYDQMANMIDKNAPTPATSPNPKYH